MHGDYEAEFHNVFFSDDYRQEFDDVFGPRFGGRRRPTRLTADPSIYLCAQSRSPAAGPRANQDEAIFILANAPATSSGQRPSIITPSDIESCEATMRQTLSTCGLDLEIKHCRITSPQDFAGRFAGTQGALYGSATHNPFAPFTRPTARSRMPGLYLAGGATHPGAGVPMACLSGRFAAQAIAKDLDLIAPSKPAAISGGTSTSSRTTVATP